MRRERHGKTTGLTPVGIHGLPSRGWSLRDGVIHRTSIDPPVRSAERTRYAGGRTLFEEWPTSRKSTAVSRIWPGRNSTHRTFRERGKMKASMHLKKKLLASVITATVAAAVVTPSAFAQSASANLRGKTTPGANVTAFNPQTGLTRHAKAGADGMYVINGLPPASYKVDAGPGTEQTVTLTVASTATLNLAAAAAGPGDVTAKPANATAMEGMTVNATTLTEVKTPEVGGTISLHQIQTIPQVSRNFLEFADTVPGVVFNVDAQGHTSLKSGGQNSSAV